MRKDRSGKKIAVNLRILSGRYHNTGIGWFEHEISRRLIAKYPEEQFHLLFDKQIPEFWESIPSEKRSIFPPTRHPILWYLWFEWAIPPLLKKKNIDVFFSPDGHMSLRTDVPTLLVCHDIAWHHLPEGLPWSVRRYYEYFVPRFLRKAAHIVTVSEYVKQDIVHHIGIPEEKISVVYNGVKEAYKPISPEAQEQVKAEYTNGHDYFLFVGSLHPRKNVARQIEAYGRYRDQFKSSHKFVIVGNPAWQTEDITRAHQESTYKEDILFVGNKDLEELSALTAAAHCMLYPSLSEGFGVPIVEAMYCDVPVITSNVSSMPEVAGDAALLVNPQDIEDIARAMIRMESEDGLRQMLIKKARLQRQKYDWDHSAEQIYALLRDLASRK